MDFLPGSLLCILIIRSPQRNINFPLRYSLQFPYRILHFSHSRSRFYKKASLRDMSCSASVFFCYPVLNANMQGATLPLSVSVQRARKEAVYALCKESEKIIYGGKKHLSCAEGSQPFRGKRRICRGNGSFRLRKKHSFKLYLLLYSF